MSILITSWSSPNKYGHLILNQKFMELGVFTSPNTENGLCSGGRVSFTLSMTCTPSTISRLWSSANMEQTCLSLLQTMELVKCDTAFEFAQCAVKGSLSFWDPPVYVWIQFVIAFTNQNIFHIYFFVRESSLHNQQSFKIWNNLSL